MKVQDDSVPSLAQFTRFWWDELAKKVSRAVVFMDSASAECLHWNSGGAPALFKAGAVGVRELTSFESGGKDHHKAVFIVSGPVEGAAEMCVRDVVLGSRFDHCIVVTAAPATVHSVQTHLRGAEVGLDDDPNNLRVFVDLERRLLRWMGSQELTAEVMYCPLFAAQLSDNFFITPPFTELPPLLFPPSPHQQKPKGTVSSHVELTSKGIPGIVHHLAACLHSLLVFHGAREDIFSVGESAAVLAATLEALPAARVRRKSAERRVSLVLVDRVLDLATACNLDTSFSVLDKLLCVLPKFSGHSTERGVDMSLLCNSYKCDDVSLPQCLAQGCALQPAGIAPILESKSIKEELLSMQRRFIEVVPGIAATLRVTPDSLLKRARALAQDGGIKLHAPLLQQCLGVLQSLSLPLSSNVDLLAGLQKVLIQNLAIGGLDRGLADVLSQIISLVQTRKDRGLDLHLILVLIIHAFSLAGPEQVEQQAAVEGAEKLKNELATAMLEDGVNPWMEDVKDETEANQIASEIMQRLVSVARARQHFTRYRELLYRPSLQQAAEVKPLFPRLLADCLDHSRPELGPDIASTGSGSLRNTLGMFLSAAKVHPSDNPLLIFLVLGGITGSELRELRFVASQQSNRVLIGATSLQSPQDTLSYLQSHPHF